MIDWPKRDDRPQRGMWAPGNYHCKCHRCEQMFIGDKRAITCADCAYAVSSPHHQPSEKQT